MMDCYKAPLEQAQLKLLFSQEGEKYTDARVTCKGIKWKVHQSILCARCQFFEACFRDGSFKEGEEKVVDFHDDEPYGVEALLIYLYTLKFPYPTIVLEEPEIEEPASTSGETGSTTATANTHRWTRDSNCFKIKSRGAEELWQEQLGLYCIAHRLGLTFLATLSMVIMTNNIDESLRSSTVKMFIRRLYCLEHPEIQQLKDRVAEKVADQGSCDFFGNELSAIITSHPDFGYDLVKAMAEKDKRQMEMIAELTRPSDKQKKRPRLIGDVSDDSSAEY